MHIQSITWQFYMHKPSNAESHSEQYFLTEINTTSCLTTVQCMPIFQEQFSRCIVQYSTDGLLHPIALTPLNTSTLPPLTPDSVYLFEFSIISNRGDFTIKNIRRVEYTSQNISKPSCIDLWMILQNPQFQINRTSLLFKHSTQTEGSWRVY